MIRGSHPYFGPVLARRNVPFRVSSFTKVAQVRSIFGYPRFTRRLRWLEKLAAWVTRGGIGIPLALTSANLKAGQDGAGDPELL